MSGVMQDPRWISTRVKRIHCKYGHAHHARDNRNSSGQCRTCARDRAAYTATLVRLAAQALGLSIYEYRRDVGQRRAPALAVLRSQGIPVPDPIHSEQMDAPIKRRKPYVGGDA